MQWKAKQVCAQVRIITLAKQRCAQWEIAGRESRHPYRSNGLADGFCLFLKSSSHISLLSLLSHNRHGFFLIDKAEEVGAEEALFFCLFGVLHIKTNAIILLGKAMRMARPMHQFHFTLILPFGDTLIHSSVIGNFL